MKCASCGKRHVDKYHECDRMVTPNGETRDSEMKTSSFEEVKKKADEELSRNKRAPRGW